MLIYRSVFIAAFSFLVSGCIGLDVLQPEKLDDYAVGVDKSSQVIEGRTVSNDGYLWAGIVITPVVPLPIPLAVPVGKAKMTEYHDRNGVLIKREIRKTKSSGFACIFLLYCQTDMTLGSMIFDPPDVR